ncbi:MAG: pentapeptide repeat-containing protein [Geminicoccaceae bacterium]|nr:pentapeptide repeat-containing protein [Geminicoccaceae bacterium]
MSNDGLQEAQAGYGQTVVLTRPSSFHLAGQALFGRLFQPFARIFSTAMLGPAAPAGEAAAEILASFKPKDSLEEAGWRLVYLALTTSIDELVGTLPERPIVDASIAHEHLMQLGDGPALDEIAIPFNFLDRPQDVPLLDAVGAALSRVLQRFGVAEPAARSAAIRLPSYFVHTLEQCWREHPEYLQAIESLTRSAPAVAAHQERQWDHYRARLAKELDEPLFADPFSLRQLYQPLRAYRVERPARRDDRSEAAPTAKNRHEVVWLKEAMDAWLDRFDPHDALRVVAGGPGSGKSSFVKVWACDVLAREARQPILLIPLQHIDRFDLEQVVADHAKWHGFARSPVDPQEGEKRLLLILDGLDELDVDGNRGQDAASNLVTAADKLLSRFNEHDRQLRILIAGRAVIVEALEGHLNRPGKIFHVLGYSLTDAEKEDAEWIDLSEALAVAQEDAWWQTWSELNGGRTRRLPPVKHLADLARQPLLNHLMAIAGAADLDPASSVNDVFALVLRRVWERAWGPGREPAVDQLPALKALDPDTFERLFESIGLAVWQHGGGRTTTLAHVATIIDEEGLGEQYGVFKNAIDQGALALLTAFYFRRIGGSGTPTFELTHKSFGDYLAARGLFRLLGKLDAADATPEADKALQRWYGATHAARITPEIAAFLQGELRRPAGSADDEARIRRVVELRATLIRMFDENLRTGMPIAQPSASSFRQLQEFTGAAELALFVCIGACSRALLEAVKDRDDPARAEIVRWRPAWSDRQSQGRRHDVADLLRRLQHGTLDDRMPTYALTGIDMTAQAAHMSMTAAHCEMAAAVGADLSGADLSCANLSDADLSHANLSRANLSGADLSGANLSDADLSDADLSANLIRANLSDADLFSANLSGADLIRANLSGADLGYANLSHANLIRANLSDADLSGANLIRADLSGVGFHENTKVSKAQLQQAINVDWDRVPAHCR